jgi:accessory gene regulator protein AgrB
MMSHRNAGLAYAGFTSALIVAMSVSGWCWGRVNSSGLHTICIAVWALCGVLLGLSQIAFIVIAVRMKHYVVLALAVVVLVAIAGFVFLLSRMPS